MNLAGELNAGTSVFLLCLPTAKVMWIDPPSWNASSLAYWREVVLFLLLAYLHTTVKRKSGVVVSFFALNLQNLMKINDEIKYILLCKQTLSDLLEEATS